MRRIILSILLFTLFSCEKKEKIDTAVWADHILMNSPDANTLSNKYILIKNQKIHKIIDKNNLNDFDIKEKIKFKNSLILPGFANTHTHLAMHSLRGVFGHFNIKKWWQEEMKPHEDKNLNPNYVYKNSLKGIKEQLRNGTTLVNDMFLYSAQVIKAAEELGIRGVFGETIYTNRELDNKSFEQIMNEYRRLREKYKDNNQIKISLSPQTLFTLDRNHLAKILSTAESDKVLFHTHHNETSKGNVVMIDKGFKSSVDGLIKLGLNKNVRSLFAHGVHNNEADYQRLKDLNISYSLNYLSNILLGAGIADFNLLKKSSRYFTLGTDSVASNPTNSMRNEISSVFSYFRFVNQFESKVFSRELIKMATYNGYQALGFKNGGLIKEGADADFQIYSFKEDHQQDRYQDFVLNLKNYSLKKLFVLGKVVYSE